MSRDPVEYDDEPTEPFGADWWDPTVPLAAVAAGALVGIVLLLVWALVVYKP